MTKLANIGDVWVLIGALLTLVAGWGCSAEGRAQGREEDALSWLRPRTDTGVELRVVLPRDSISVSDREPIEVYYFVVNGPVITTFDNDPDRFNLTVTTSDNSPVQPDAGSSPILTVQGERVKVVLPGGALLGQVQNLRCIVQGRYTARNGTQLPCMAEYDLNRPGTYRVILEYAGPAEVNFDSLSALADSGKLDRPLREYLRSGRRLADTATLVVVP